jgi:opacity protein-like surface antigen
VGLRLGFWSNQGDKPPEGGSSGDFSYRTHISNANFYFEGFAAYRLARPLMAELSIGIVNRGSVTLNEGNITDVGNLLVYPMLVHLKFYPLATLNARFQPYITAGGGLYYGRRNVQITTSYYYSGFAEESSTKFGYSLGGGVDWPLSQIIGLDLNVRYMPIKYSDPLVTVSDFSAFTVAVGVKYLYAGKKE